MDVSGYHELIDCICHPFCFIVVKSRVSYFPAVLNELDDHHSGADILFHLDCVCHLYSPTRLLGALCGGGVFSGPPLACRGFSSPRLNGVFFLLGGNPTGPDLIWVRRLAPVTYYSRTHKYK